MPLAITDLHAGDRVVLNCAQARVTQKREAIFEGVFASVNDAMHRGGYTAIALPGGRPTEEFLNGGAWARFLMQSCEGVDLVGAFRIEPDGALREEEGRRITIERRVRMGQG